jgi:uncharacterized protein (TIGR02246 family)
MRFLMAILVVLTLAAPVGAQAPAGSGAEEAAVKKLVQEWDAVRNNGDWKAFAQFYTPEATSLSSDGTWRKNRQEIEKGATDVWTSTYKGAKYRTTVESVRSLAPNVTVADARFEISNISGGGSRKGRTTLLLVKSDRGWRIAAVRHMVPVPAGAARTSG